MISLLWPVVLLIVVISGNESTLKSADFEKDIWPLFRDRCVECHSGEQPKGGLALDVKDAALKGGDSGEMIVPGKSVDSALIERVSSNDANERMPPKGERLTAEQVALLRDWIDSGARWTLSDEQTRVTKQVRSHWSLLPLSKPQIPDTSLPDGQRKNHPIDAFIAAKLSESGLGYTSEADRRTLIRRVTFDLIGLPPTPQEVQTFIEDRDPRAYENLVDRLLASPRYGEHWARHWLDVVHYADTHGNDHDHARPNAWPYRDYVIGSLNEDKPYARFVAEQVASDVLFADDPQLTVALGFLAAGPWDDTLMVTVREDTVDHRMGQNLDRDNMVSTVMSTFSSLTVHCARCHDHKFDPISQREYYGLQAVFAGVDRADRAFDSDRQTTFRRRELMARKSAIAARSAQVMTEIDSPEMATKIAAAEDRIAQRNQQWEVLEVINIVSTSAPEGTKFARQADGSWFVSGTRPEKDTFIITARTQLKGVRALRLEVLPDARLPQGGPGRYDNGNFHLSQFRVMAQPSRGETNGAERLKIARALADHADAADVVSNAIDEKPETHWSIHPRYNESHEAVFELLEPAGYDAGTTLTILLDFTGTTGHQIGRFRMGVCTDALSAAERAPTPAAIANLLKIPEKVRTRDQQRELALHLLDAEIERALASLPAPQFVYAATRDFAPRGSFKPTLRPRPIHVLARGDINKPGELAPPAALGCVPELAPSLEIHDADDESSRRAALAKWLIDERNVLTWRSIVNRVWHYHFGRGICDTPNDFGRMGGVPSHAELLDWLAVWFRDDAHGSLKALHRLIVTSDAFRQGSGVGLSRAGRSPLADQIDSDNRLLWRMNRTRLTGEMLRDAVLQFSGQLDLTMGGPPVVQFQHRGKAKTFMPADGSPPFVDYEHFDPDASENRRRAIYRFVFRTVPDPLMDALDCPDGGAMTPVRSVSTTALQALAMLNNAFLIRQCEHIAERIAGETQQRSDQVIALFRLMLQRDPSDRERTSFTAYVERHGLANACHVVLNSNEFQYLD